MRQQQAAGREAEGGEEQPDEPSSRETGSSSRGTPTWGSPGGGASWNSAESGGGSGGSGSEQGGSGSESTPLSDDEGEGESGEEGEANFDRAATSRHAYLGDNLEDLESSRCPLEPGRTYRVPLFPLEGIVLCPGDTLPLKLQHPADQALAQRAVQAPPPLTGLIAVACLVRSGGWRASIPAVGCLAAIRQIRLQDDGTLSVLSRGRQRARLSWAAEAALSSHVVAAPLPDPPPLRVPREVASLAAWWRPWAYAPYDAYGLARSARELLAAVAPRAPSFLGDPLALSYWLVSNLPLDDHTRQALLEAHSAAERLRREVRLLREMGRVRCRRCSAHVGELREVVQMSEEGLSGRFVNPHGVVHDIACFSKVRGVTLEGSPQTESSWFPGYAWTVAYCRACWHHLGWRFTAVQHGLRPACFWGLRRSAIQGASWSAALLGGGEGEGEGEEEEQGGTSSDSEAGGQQLELVPLED